MEQQSKYRGLVELIGIVAVAASLVFVGLEIRQKRASNSWGRLSRRFK